MKRKTKIILFTFLGLIFLTVYTSLIIYLCIPTKITTLKDGGTTIIESKIMTVVDLQDNADWRKAKNRNRSFYLAE